VTHLRERHAPLRRGSLRNTTTYGFVGIWETTARRHRTCGWLNLRGCETRKNAKKDENGAFSPARRAPLLPGGGASWRREGARNGLFPFGFWKRGDACGGCAWRQDARAAAGTGEKKKKKKKKWANGRPPSYRRRGAGEVPIRDYKLPIRGRLESAFANGHVARHHGGREAEQYTLEETTRFGPSTKKKRMAIGESGRHDFRRRSAASSASGNQQEGTSRYTGSHARAHTDNKKGRWSAVRACIGGGTGSAGGGPVRQKQTEKIPL
jgi:hypothetical protein